MPDAAAAPAAGPSLGSGSAESVRATLQQTFGRFDVDRTGRIAADEVWPLCYALGYA